MRTSVGLLNHSGSSAVRLVGTVCLTLLVASCGRSDPVSPANPVAPTATTQPTGSSFTLSGVVAEDGHPIANANVFVAGIQSCSSGCSSKQFNVPAGMTDAAGRYRVIVKPPEETPATIWVIAGKDGFVQQCVASTTMRADGAEGNLDLQLTSVANLSLSHPPSAPGTRTVSGVVFESTPTRKETVEGVSVGWEGLFDTVLAVTKTDAAGRYSLCGLPLGPIAGLFASKQGYSDVAYASVGAGTDAVVDIEITRR